jgi:2-polyprenyl-6-methoxyphenol hydroxylase-like FAD-dependent oxidoreductase
LTNQAVTSSSTARGLAHRLARVSDIAAHRSPQALKRRIQGLLGDVPYELVWLSDYRFHQRLLDRLRHGRIFSVGDAAQLAWKLAWVLRGDAPETLLDTMSVNGIRRYVAISRSPTPPFG